MGLEIFYDILNYTAELLMYKCTESKIRNIYQWNDN